MKKRDEKIKKILTIISGVMLFISIAVFLFVGLFEPSYGDKLLILITAIDGFLSVLTIGYWGD